MASPKDQMNESLNEQREDITSEARARAFDAFKSLRQQAKDNGLPDITLEEINEEIGRCHSEKAALDAFTRIADVFEGAAEEAGFDSEEEMQEYMKDIRKEIREY